MRTQIISILLLLKQRNHMKSNRQEGLDVDFVINNKKIVKVYEYIKHGKI